jgi:bifunctional aspartokinase / homoserine dehydrogenase 1
MSKQLTVMKFGGTSVGSPECIARAADLVAAATAHSSVAVVVSAMSKVTDTLLDTLQRAEQGDEEGVEAHLRALGERHHQACRALLPESRCAEIDGRIDELLGQFGRIARGILMLGERPPRSIDDAVSAGEKLSALLLSELLNARGTPAEAVSGAEVIVTDDVFGNASPLMDETNVRAGARLLPLIEAGRVPVITGFNGSTADGRPTTLGRGGSDFSASLVAAAIEASELWIWTDVDGILSGDPRLVPDARVLPEVTFDEAAELAYNGAKVLHPRTLAPVVDKEIPVWIKNSFDPAKPGTRIVAKLEGACGVRAITSLPHVTLVSIEAASASMSGAQLMARALQAAARANVEVLLLTRSSFRQNFCILVRTPEVGGLIENLHSELALELAHGYVHPIRIDHSVGLLAAVGEGMRGTPGMAGKLFNAISERDINIIAIAQGSSELTIAVVVRQDALEDAVRAIHASCGLGQSEPVPLQAAR